MNLYCLVEGKQTEKKVYRAWLNHVFPQLQEVKIPEDAISNNFYILAGKGYPHYLKRIHKALKEVIHYQFDKLMICVDTEQFSVAEMREELSKHISEGEFFAGTYIILQHCCIESWFLGHSKMLRCHPHSERLRQFKAFFDVSVNDPEEMGYPPKYEVRAEFHFQYLKEMLRERKIKYTKKNPRDVQDQPYLQALVNRYEETGHLTTFGELIHLWRTWGGKI